MSVIGWRQMPDDRTIRIDGSLEGMASIAAATPSREAILEAAQALEDGQNERRSMHPKHMQVLSIAWGRRREFLERVADALSAGPQPGPGSIYRIAREL